MFIYVIVRLHHDFYFFYHCLIGPIGVLEF